MHLKDKNKYKNPTSKLPPFDVARNWEALNQLAEQLDEFARFKLRDGVLCGILQGCENEIRQDAILMALDWFLERESGTTKRPPWQPARAIAIALHYTKMRHVHHLAEHAHRHVEADETNAGLYLHHFHKTALEWPEESKIEMIHQAIQAAVRMGRLSHANACVALRVYRAGETVVSVADRLGVTSGAIYQRLGIVRREIAPILETMDPPCCP